MEIGVCRNGEGVVVLDEKDYFYQNGTITIIPQNISHTTISNGMQKNAWEYLYLNPDPVIAKLYDGQLAKSNEALQLLRSGSLFLDAASYPFLMAEIDAAMNEMRTQGMHYRQMVNAFLQAILIEVLRMQVKGQEHRLETSTSNNMRQISDALSYVENHYAEAMKVKERKDAFIQQSALDIVARTLYYKSELKQLKDTLTEMQSTSGRADTVGVHEVSIQMKSTNERIQALQEKVLASRLELQSLKNLKNANTVEQKIDATK